mgnify:CR=1 FL=1
MDLRLEHDLQRCLSMISASWEIQNNGDDRTTNFIYNVPSLDDCLRLISEKNVSEEYALHRWYNYHTSVYCEYLFCDYGAIHEENVRNHDVDIYIDDIPFDVKLTVYPRALSKRPYNLTNRCGKNNMIKWFYSHQSQGNRKQMLNRLYVVCDGDNAEENLRMKSDFSLLREKISAFMEYVRNHGLNKIEIFDNNQRYELYSDIIYIYN